MVTTQDLDNLRTESKKDRHETRGFVMTEYIKHDAKIDALWTEIALLKNQDSHFMEKLDNIWKIIEDHMKNEEKSMDKLFDAINGLRKEIKNDYVTKEALTPIKNTQSFHNRIFFVWWGTVLLAVLTAVLNKLWL